MTLLLTGSDETVHGILGAMRFVSTGGATRAFEGPAADLVHALARTFDGARTDLDVGGAVLDSDGVWASADEALSELCSALPDERARHEAMVAGTLCLLMRDDFDPAGEQALEAMSEAFGVDEEAAVLISSLTQSSAEVAGADLFRRFLAERSDESLEVISARIDRLEEPITTPPEDFDAYVELLHGSPEGSVGSELLRFYRHTGYEVPEAPGIPPLAVLGNHDLHHVLSGYSTSNNDEVNVAMFTASNSNDGGLYYLAVVLLQWHHNLKISPFDPSTSVLVPEELAQAAARGATTTADLSDRSWDWQSVIPQDLHDVRQTLGVTSGGTVGDGGAWDARGLGDR